METKTLLRAFALAALATATMACSQKPQPPKQVYKEDWEDLNRYPQAEWLNELKFGMYYHWNFSTLALSPDGWYGRNMYKPGSAAYKQHVKNFGGPEKFGYKDFAPLFTAEGFDAKEWVDNLDRAGGKFMVGMAVHHDGFDLYKSSYTKWNSVDMLPHIDIMGELAKEARKKGMKFGVTSHLAFNWVFFSETLFPDKYDAKSEPDFYNIHDPKKGPTPAFVDEWYNRTVELIDNYQPDFLWFDFGTKEEGFNKEHTRRLTAHYYNRAEEWGKTVAMASKFGFENDKSKVHDLEQGAYGYIHYPLWMSDCTMNKGWFFNGMRAKDDKNATGHYWLHRLIDIVSKNGTLLLNVGPKPDGAWPEDYKAELFKMGDWLNANEEAIYYTKPWHRFGEGPTFDVDGSHYNLGTTLTNKDIRFTRNGDTLYAIVCGWNDKEVAIRSLGTDDMGEDLKIRRISLVGSNASVQWKQGKEALIITAPEGVDKTAYAYSFRIEGKGLFPERPDEYANVYIPCDSKGVKKAVFTIEGEASIALSELTFFGSTASRRKLDAESTAHSPLEAGTMDMLFDKNFSGHPRMGSILRTKNIANPTLEFTFKKPQDLHYITLFPAMEGGEVFLKKGLVHLYDADNTLIKTIKLPIAD